MTTRIISLALTLCLFLTACGGKEERGEGQASLLVRATGLEEEEILLTVDGREVPVWRYLYWLAYTCDRIQKQYDRARLSLDWKVPMSGGTLADYARDQALADTVLYATVENWAERYGVSAGEQFSGPAMPEVGLSAEQMAELEKVGGLYAALYDLYETAGSALAPTEEALADFARAQGWLTVEQFLIPYGEDREAARRSAEEAFAALNGAEDTEAAFSALTGGTTPQTLQAGDGTMVPSLEEAAAALEEGQCSGILESEDGYSILRRLAPDTAPVREAYFDHLLQSAAESAALETTEAYDTLEVAAFYRRWKELREEN